MIGASVYFKVQRHTRSCWFTVLPSLAVVRLIGIVFGDEAIITCSLRSVHTGLASWLSVIVKGLVKAEIFV